MRSQAPSSRKCVTRTRHLRLTATLRALPAAALCLLALAALPACSSSDGGDADVQPATTATAAPVRGAADPKPDETRDEPRPLLPDLQTMPINELYVVPGAAPGSRVLRFSTTVLNAGEGPLDLAGSYDVADATVTTTQRVVYTDGSMTEREVGRFVYHPAHAHWHFEDFTLFEVWTHDARGQLDRLVATTGKATFCAVDEVPVEPDAPEPAYLACGEQVQGISAGWSDTYGAEIPGQELDISGLPDGRYAVRSAVDPAGRLAETDEDNNSFTTYVELRGMEIAVLEEG